MKTPVDLQQYITQQGIAAELVFPAQETPTVPLAAQAMGCREDQIIKSVLFLVNTDSEISPLLAISTGTSLIDQRLLANLLGVGRKRVKLASPEIVLQFTGYPAGGVPPFGHTIQLPTYLGRDVLEQPFVYGGGGDEHTLLRITPQELLRVTGAQIVVL